jgi:hypothetical protein
VYRESIEPAGSIVGSFVRLFIIGVVSASVLYVHILFVKSVTYIALDRCRFLYVHVLFSTPLSMHANVLDSVVSRSTALHVYLY